MIFRITLFLALLSYFYFSAWWTGGMLYPL